MDTVIVTGALGRSGRWIADRLADEYDVVAVDLDQPGFEVTPRENLDFRAADLTNMGEVADLVAEIDPDAVVHWAAIPSPTRHAGNRVFETNVQSTYNVLVAAARAGARIVWASSESAYGFAFADETPLPDFLPVTEDHPLRPEDPYGTAKVAGEEISKMVDRKYGVSTCAIRPSWIQYPGEYNCRGVAESGDLAGGAGNCWSYVDVRDVAGLVAAALDNPVDGHEAVHAAAAETYLGRPTADAVEEFWGELPDGCTLDGEESALSTAKAGELFDWEPAYSWHEAADEDVSEPTLWE
ncbi:MULTISPECIES: NAD(P)-dependent oxidoreductase [Haloferax]|uniref:NAD-dependent epimerase/dehydratase family protein n=1 Tax=Haloferax marinum TaxID=2666143 RepID=A0A6A8G6F2_9EURY|nr:MULTISPECIES: NAD(P)-dependent oxidoreductase [Haloferax]KAB1197617.1 NAD(P)-dependent oxidoreductase [Haloferax sp. CBA1150]MRW96669.1 NAD-dependent epimerase/dehydratase family protein [Haloferax marinum]